MTTAASNIVFDDIFTISAIDKEGKKFDRGSFVSSFPSSINLIILDLLQCRVYTHTQKIMTWISH